MWNSVQKIYIFQYIRTQHVNIIQQILQYLKILHNFERHLQSVQHTVHSNLLTIHVSVLPCIAPLSPTLFLYCYYVCLCPFIGLKLGQLWGGCYEKWRFYTSVNVLQWYKLVWIGCYVIWRFCSTVNVLQWYKLLWIGCYVMWRFCSTVNVLQWYKLVWIGCYVIWRFYPSVNVLQQIQTNRIQ